MLTYLAQGVGYGFSAAAQPGPFQAYLVAETLGRGWRRTLPAALAPLLSDGPIIALCLLVLSRVPPWFQRALAVAGGAYLLFLARGAFASWRRFDPDAAAAAVPRGRSVVRAALTNALNPGPYIYWSLVTGPVLLAGWRESPVAGLAFLASFYASIVLSLATLIVVFGTARRLGPAVSRGMLGLSAVALAAFGLVQLYRGVR